MSIYTKLGDGGMTDLVGGGRTPKSSALVCAYGDIDELSAHLGLLRAMMRPDDETALIEQVQQLLFAVGANITPSQQQSVYSAQPQATPSSPHSSLLQQSVSSAQPQVTPSSSHSSPLQQQSAPQCGSTSAEGQHAPGRMYARAAALMEQHIDAMTAALPPLHNFVLPGGSVPEAQCHVCRTVCRRAERAITALDVRTEACPYIMAFLNRLSDYLFVLARKLNFIIKQDEKTWNKTCR